MHLCLMRGCQTQVAWEALLCGSMVVDPTDIRLVRCCLHAGTNSAEVESGRHVRRLLVVLLQVSKNAHDVVLLDVA